uniref:Uncharacterized protein n=1 Tax=viral metagenome TaxID=1070528 RepID=A0A6H1Z8U2_9ZZZZ
MPPPHRLAELILILVPSEEVEHRLVLLAGKMACRVAAEQEFHPVCPPLTYGVFLPEEAVTSHKLRRITWYWYRHCSRLWLCFPPIDAEPRLDPLTYEILSANETRGFVPKTSRDKARLSVHLMLWSRQENYSLKRLAHEELNDLLRRNIPNGLLGRALL